MDSALLQNLIAGAGSSSQFIGGVVVAVLYLVIGLLSAIGSVFVFRRIFQGLMGTDILDLFSCRYCRLLPKLRCLFRGLNSCLADRSSRRFRFSCLCCGWTIFAVCYRGWLCHAWAVGSVPLSVRLFTGRPVDNRNSTGLRYLLLNVRFCGRVLSHDK
jgi:hypothetical protein